MIIFFVKYPSFLSTTYLLYSSAELLALRDQEEESVFLESSVGVVVESLHPATISGGGILSDANVSLSSGIGTNIAAISSDHAQQSCRLCTGMPLDPENDWCLLLESGMTINQIKIAYRIIACS
jgi:hypothetical protein